jgi:hypothetical protein
MANANENDKEIKHYELPNFAACKRVHQYYMITLIKGKI